MTPTMDLIKSPTTQSIKPSSSIFHRYLFSIVILSFVSNNSRFYQYTTVDANEEAMYTIFPIIINTISYHEGLILTIILQKVITLADISSPFISNLISTVVECYDMSIAIAKREFEVTISAIHNSIIFCDRYD